MNLKQRDDLLEAAADCVKGFKAGRWPKEEGYWQIGLRAGGPLKKVAVGCGREPWTGFPGPWKRSPFSAKAFGDAGLEKALSEFAALHRPAALWRGPNGSWALPITDRPTWPRFLRCDVSARFSADASQLSLLARDLYVNALVFDGETLWAFLGA